MQSYTHFFWPPYKVFGEAHNFLQLHLSSKNPFWMDMSNLDTIISSHSSPTTMVILVSCICFVLSSIHFIVGQCWMALHLSLCYSQHCCCCCYFCVLILENQNAEQQYEQVKHFMAMMAATTAGAKRTNEEADDDNTGRRKWRMIKYNHECAKRCIQQDYLGLSLISHHCKFQWIFCIS